MTRPASISGFPEWSPAQRMIEQQLLDRIRATFESYGFAPLETRAVEPLDQLLRKGETSKEVYLLRRLQADTDQATGADDDALGLHFDLTVPFARYVLENAGRLHFPFRRYQIQKVWRGERPQEGRYREFTQADIDIVDSGELPTHYEVELPLVIADALRKLPVPEFVVKVNNRKIPEGFYRGLGLDDVTTVLRIVDKIDKIGPGKVIERLVESGATDAQAKLAVQLADISSTDTSFVDKVRALGVEHEILDEGLEQLSQVMTAANEHAPGLLMAGVVFALIMGVIMGFVWEHRLSGGYSWGDPKVIITLAILAAYVAYLRLSRSTAWRGARAAKLCAFNFAVVLFSYTFVNLYMTRFHRFF